MSTVWFLWRLFFAVVLIRISLGFVSTALSASYLGAFGGLLVAAAAFILAVIVISPDLARLAALPFTAFVDSIYFPGGSGKKPPLDFTLAEHYRRTMMPELAEAEYLRILRHHPGEVSAYLGLADVRSQQDGIKAAERVLSRAERRFRKSPEAMGLLAEARRKMRRDRDVAGAGSDG